MSKEVDGQRLSMKDTRVAVIGYDDEARTSATGLRRAGNHVTIGICVGGMRWVRAQRDGFVAKPSSIAVEDADVVAIHSPDDEHCSIYWRVVAPHARPDALLVFGHALPLATGALETNDVDVVVVTGNPSACRVAVHADVSGRALERAVAYARAAYGAYAQIGTTTVAAEAERELLEHETRLGGRAALVHEVERRAADARDSHGPDEARLAYYEALRALVEERERASDSSVRLVAGAKGARRGVA